MLELFRVKISYYYRDILSRKTFLLGERSLDEMRDCEDPLFDDEVDLLDWEEAKKEAKKFVLNFSYEGRPFYFKQDRNIATVHFCQENRKDYDREDLKVFPRRIVYYPDSSPCILKAKQLRLKHPSIEDILKWGDQDQAYIYLRQHYKAAIIKYEKGELK